MQIVNTVIIRKKSIFIFDILKNYYIFAFDIQQFKRKKEYNFSHIYYKFDRTREKEVKHT